MTSTTTTPPATDSQETQDGGSLGRMLSVLGLFSKERPIWSTAEIIDTIGATRSTGYRYVKILHDAGFLASPRNGHYSLGPRIVEMDMQMRLTDPLLLASEGVLEGLVERVGHSALLCTAFQDEVLCIGEARAPSSPPNRFIRGQRRPLFQSAVSKVILAYLPHYRLKSFYAQSHDEIAAANLGTDWSEFRQNLTNIKRDGYLVTVGEFTPGVHGVAAPVFSDKTTVAGSIGVAWDSSRRTEVENAIEAVRGAARTVTERLIQASK